MKVCHRFAGNNTDEIHVHPRKSVAYSGIKMKSILSVFLIVLTAGWPVRLRAQEQEEVVRVRSNEVRLDVVVKDKKGRPIRDLKNTDFEVFEDGVPQKVESFRFVTREASAISSETKENKAAPAGVTASPGKRSTP